MRVDAEAADQPSGTGDEDDAVVDEGEEIVGLDVRGEVAGTPDVEDVESAGFGRGAFEDGGLVFVEYVFSYPGAGLTLQQAALGNDYPLTQGLLVVFALCVIAANFFMDLLNLVLDPRVRTG